MALNFEPLHPLFVAEVSGVDLRAPLGDEDHEAIEAGMARYGVLVFRGQRLSEDQHASFMRTLGPIDAGLTIANRARSRLANADVIDLANVGPDGEVLDPGHVRNVSLIANQMWHSDSSFKDPPAKYSSLCAVDVPAEGGETEFADQRAAYDELPDGLKRVVDSGVAEHYAFHSRNMLGGGGYSQAGIDALPPVNWPMAHRIAESGRRSLFIGVHTREIQGMPTAIARMLLMDLLEHATQRRFVYRHHWRNDDLVMWDNRCTLHRGRRYDLTRKREMRRCTTELVHDDEAQLEISS